MINNRGSNMNKKIDIDIDKEKLASQAYYWPNTVNTP